jgi:integrase/recombinase XerD
MGFALWTEFFDELEHVRGRSRNTIMAYRRDLELYAEFRKKHSDISSFYPYMKKHGLSDRSQARVISSLRTYFRFLEERGHEASELRELRLPKIKASLPKVISVEQFKKLLDSCVVEDKFRSARNHLTLKLLFGVGCRVSEMIDLNLNDFSESDATLTITGKGGKQRLVPLTEHLVGELKSYLTECRSHLLRSDTTSVLINDRGKRPSRVDIWRWLQTWSERAGFDEVISPHKFRHGCATALLESGADLRSIQMLLGHSSLQTTQIYTTVSTKKMAETIEKHHPLSDSE